MATINNEWITLDELRNGVTVQRKFAGLDTFINHVDNSVEFCKVKFCTLLYSLVKLCTLV